MFYLIIAILVMSYYFFMAPKSVRGTINMISMVAFIVFLLVLAVMSFVKLIQSPPEIFVGIGMLVLAYFAMRDVLRLPERSNDSKSDD